MSDADERERALQARITRLEADVQLFGAALRYVAACTRCESCLYVAQHALNHRLKLSGLSMRSQRKETSGR